MDKETVYDAGWTYGKYKGIYSMIIGIIFVIIGIIAIILTKIISLLILIGFGALAVGYGWFLKSRANKYFQNKENVPTKN